MYTRYGKSRWDAQKQGYIRQFAPGVNSKRAKTLYEERIRFFEILEVCLDLSTYLLALSLRATSKIDEHAHLHVTNSLIGYSREAMQEMLVIRLKDLFHAKKDDPEEFKFHGFHQTLRESGTQYPQPNLEINNAIARIIKRRNFYSAHHRDGKKEYSLARNHIHSLDLFIAMAYIGKVEESLHGGKTFDLFERLINDNIDVDRPLVLCDTYEAMTGLEYEHLSQTGTHYTTPSGVEVVDGEYEYTSEFKAYDLKARREIQRIREKVQKIIE